MKRGAAVIGTLVALVIVTLGTASESWFEYKTRTQAAAEKHRAKRAAEAQEKNEKVNSRQKRTIAFPTGSKFALTPIFCIPLVTETNVTGKLYIEVPFIVNLPNSTDITSAFAGRADNGKIGIYSLIMDAMRRFGVDGKSCLLKTICEVAETPLKEDGLLGEVMNLLFSVSHDPLLHELEEYGNAEYYGKSYGDCHDAYPDCSVSLFKLMQ